MIDKSKLMRLLADDAGALFAVVDASHSPAVLPALHASGLELQCLFSGISAITLARCAPYLVRIPPQDERLLALVAALWGCHSLFFLNAESELSALRVELKKWLQAKLPDGSVGLFRFYDPRVWRRTMLHATPAQRASAFGGAVRRYVTELDDGRSALVLSARAPTGLAAWVSSEPTVDVARIELEAAAPTRTQAAHV